MKKIEVTIRAHQFDDVREALRSISVDNVTMREVRSDSPRDHQVGIIPEARLEMLVPAERAAEVIRALASSRWSSLIADGKLMVYEVAEPVRAQNL